VTHWERLREAALRRIHGPYRALGQLDARIDDVQQRLAALEDRAAATHQLLSDELRPVLRALAAEESSNRRRLRELRAEPDYELAWSEPHPLVTVTVATHNRPHLLSSRSLPSILAQSYGELEVIVVGDHADSSTEGAVRDLGDERVTFRNLSHRVHISDDPERHRLVGATMARNEATRLARGRWIVEFDDDDAMRCDCIERLIERTLDDHPEAVYGRALLRVEEGPLFEIGSFPPELGQFTWAAGMYHSGLRFLQRELFAADLGVPGDWFLAERMLRAGVRFGMVDAVLCDIYPSELNRSSG
jgi:glycosyltransferase involved in cell wall biosynthesis